MLNATITARRFVTMSLAALLAAGAAGCPAPAQPVQVPQPEPPQPASEDQVFEGYPAIEETGTRFAPQALGTPGMIRIRAKKAAPLAAVRKQFERAKGAAKASVGQILVTMLWDEADTRRTTDQAAEQQLRDEATVALRAVHAAQGDATDEYTLRMLATAELTAGNVDQAMAALQQLIDKYPESKAAVWAKTWQGYLHLQRGQDAEAAALVEGWTPDSDQVDFLAAYVLSWVKFRARAADDARAAIVRAALDWKGDRAAFERDLLLILARTGTSVDEAVAALATYAAAYNEGAASKQYALSYQLHDAYAFVGDYDSASKALDAGAAAIGEQMPQSDMVAFRFQQANYHLLSYEPGPAAERLTESYNTLVACGAQCEATKENILGSISKIALHFHNVYAKSLDERYYAAAKKLYELYGAIPDRPDAADVKGYLDRLEQTKKNARPEMGKHDKEMMELALSLRPQALKGCYEWILQGEPELAGTVKMTIQVADTGEVAGVTTDPPGGEQGVAAVAACIEQRVRGWQFPGRTVKGVSAVVREFSFRPAPPEAPAAPAAPATP